MSNKKSRVMSMPSSTFKWLVTRETDEEPGFFDYGVMDSYANTDHGGQYA